MTQRAFPIVYARSVEATSKFYESLGFERHFQLPEEGEPGYVGLRRGDSEMAVVSRDWPEQQYGLTVGEGPRFEMFVYVNDADATISRLHDGGAGVLRPAEHMPWGERVGFVTDPDGNPVAIATATGAPLVARVRIL